MAEQNENSPATKGDLNQLRQETKADLNQLRQETKADLNQLRQETKADLNQLREDMTELIRGVETTLLKEFRKAMLPINSRVASAKVLVNSFDERLEALEDRVLNLENR
jgi:ABC-type transporter Mla subunit MlaD